MPILGLQTIFNITDGNTSLNTWSKLADETTIYTHLIIKDTDADVKISFWQGNTNEEIVSTQMRYTDKHGDDVPIEKTLPAGSYMIAIDTMYGAWGWVKLGVLTATQGTVQIITTTK